MKTFAEWALENHPEDEELNELFQQTADRIKKYVAPLTLAASLAAGAASQPGEAKAVMPMPPKMSQDEDVSDVPFDRKFLIDLAVDEQMRSKDNPDGSRYLYSPERLEKMTDLELWNYQNNLVDHIKSLHTREGKPLTKIKGPLPWLAIGSHYKWKRPEMPQITLRTRNIASSPLRGGK